MAVRVYAEAASSLGSELYTQLDDLVKANVSLQLQIRGLLALVAK